jgi:2-isopropylmalate synthase
LTEVQLYDTTLRDGAQKEGISFSVVDKLNIVRKLDEVGVHFIEGGWPGSNPKDIEFFHRAKNLSLRNSVLVAFGSTRQPKVTAVASQTVRRLKGCELH